MKSAEERLALMHQRAQMLERKRNRAILLVSGGSGTVLALCLLGLMRLFTAPLAGDAKGLFTGSSLLSESAGGYVLAAVLAFMAGVGVTALCLKRRRQPRQSRAEPEKETEKE